MFTKYFIKLKIVKYCKGWPNFVYEIQYFTIFNFTKYFVNIMGSH